MEQKNRFTGPCEQIVCTQFKCVQLVARVHHARGCKVNSHARQQARKVNFLGGFGYIGAKMRRSTHLELQNHWAKPWTLQADRIVYIYIKYVYLYHHLRHAIHHGSIILWLLLSYTTSESDFWDTIAIRGRPSPVRPAWSRKNWPCKRERNESGPHRTCISNWQPVTGLHAAVCHHHQ